ncbi:Retrotransposon Gag-like protein 9 [Labeo rohita]|uniref:Retrotransposon Gag-like protein 9 n=1 Tax=Labeo rohita TaxID=84645 RepID=A0ABQ8L2S2_LABRO|nr:Retrotransposon Gag-like protein 9 [Labeo rohita]
MDAASCLFHVHQGNRPIEKYVTDFCELCHLVTFNDVTLKDIFQHGLDEPICSCLLGGKIHWSLEQYIDFALLLSGSAVTVGIADEEVCNPTVPITPDHFHTPTFMSGIVTIMPEPPHAKPRSAKVKSAKPKPAQVMSTKSKPALVTSTKSQFAHAMPAAPGPAHAMPAAPESAPVMAARPEPAPVMAALPQPAHKMAAIPEPVHKMTAIPEPVHRMTAIPKPVHKMVALSESLAKMAAMPEPH